MWINYHFVCSASTSHQTPPSTCRTAAVAAALRARGAAAPALVVDPVLVATSGDALAADGPAVAAALLAELFPLACIVTPNAPEAEVLLSLGLPPGGGRIIPDVAAMCAAAEELGGYGARYVLLKGGHLGPLPAAAVPGAPPGAAPGDLFVVDVLYDGRSCAVLSSPWIDARGNAHGTGCTLAAALAARLAAGDAPPAAAAAARRFVWRALERSAGLALGEGPARPMHHGFRAADWRAAREAREVAEAEAAAETGGESLETSTASARLAPRPPNPIDLRCYAVTDPELIAASGLTLAEAAAAAAAGGATAVQLRSKGAGGAALAAAAAGLLAVLRPLGVPLIVNDRVDVAVAVGADGAHVGQGDLPAAAARALLGPDAILGVSVKTPAEAAAAAATGADYVGVGAVFATGTKDSSVIGLEGLRAVAAASRLPVVAIGGLGPARAGAAVGAGAAGVAAVGAVFGGGAGGAPGEGARALRAAVDAALAARRGG